MEKFSSRSQGFKQRVFLVRILMHNRYVKKSEHAAGQESNCRPTGFCKQSPSAHILAQVDDIMTGLNTSRRARRYAYIMPTFCVISGFNVIVQEWSVEAELYVGIRQCENELGSDRGSSAVRQQMSGFLNKTEPHSPLYGGSLVIRS